VLESPHPATVELELLSAEVGQVVRYDVTDPEVVYAARIVIADLVDPYLVEEPQPSPGPACSWCRVSQWCTARSGTLTIGSAPPEPDDAMVHPLDVVLAVDLDEDDDDIPF
jgi:hypothetical protein